jgi:hypothetical protein
MSDMHKVNANCCVCDEFIKSLPSDVINTESCVWAVWANDLVSIKNMKIHYITSCNMPNKYFIVCDRCVYYVKKNKIFDTDKDGNINIISDDRINITSIFIENIRMIKDYEDRIESYIIDIDNLLDPQ